MPSMPSVTINGGILAAATRKPLSKPTASPNSNTVAMTSGVDHPERNSLAMMIPPRPISDPTERSMPAVIITKVSPMAIKPTTAICRPRSCRLPILMKVDWPMSARCPVGMVRTAKMAAAIRMMPSNPRRSRVSTRATSHADRLIGRRAASGAAGSAAGTAEGGESAIGSTPWLEARAARWLLWLPGTCAMRLEAHLHTRLALVRQEQGMDEWVVHILRRGDRGPRIQVARDLHAERVQDTVHHAAVAHQVGILQQQAIECPCRQGRSYAGAGVPADERDFLRVDLLF